MILCAKFVPRLHLSSMLARGNLAVSASINGGPCIRFPSHLNAALRSIPILAVRSV